MRNVFWKSQLTVWPPMPRRVSLRGAGREGGGGKSGRRPHAHAQRWAAQHARVGPVRGESEPLCAPRDGDAVLAGHGEDGAAVVLHRILPLHTQEGANRRALCVCCLWRAPLRRRHGAVPPREAAAELVAVLTARHGVRLSVSPAGQAFECCLMHEPTTTLHAATAAVAHTPRARAHGAGAWQLAWQVLIMQIRQVQLVLSLQTHVGHQMVQLTQLMIRSHQSLLC